LVVAGSAHGDGRPGDEFFGALDRVGHFIVP
jgi:hypothetical protein